jgi:hypothetical protein
MGVSRQIVPLAFLFLFAFVLPAQAQKVGRNYFEDDRNGFRFKPLDEFLITPPKPDEEARGVICKMSGKEYLVFTNGSNVGVSPAMDVIRYAERTERGKEKGEDRSVAETKTRGDITEYLERVYRGLSKDKPLEDEEKKISKLAARHRTFRASTQSFNIPMVVDVWTFPLEDADVHLIYSVHEDKAKKYLKVYEKSAKTFRLIERKETAGLGKNAGYEELLTYHQTDAERIPGWRALPTPSEKFIIKTSSDNKKFLKEVIDRLEKSRLLYEGDFPPSADFDHVSIVRVCGTEEEFHEYGNTRPGVAGWFNPRSTELVLYDSVNTDRNSTYAVMSHEAFHQYCHFLFEQSEAHRWFDEGHGDYYGGARFKGKKAEITSQMPAGLDRLSVIKEMVNQDTYVPVEEHVNYDHQSWQGQGPSNVSCYAQSWSIIYMLRLGSLGKVSKKVWKDEYADIIPNYVSTLSAGFEGAYAEIRAKRKGSDEDEEGELSDEEIDRISLSSKQKEEIWEAAMDASWGQIDMDEFEENWRVYVKDHIK